MVFIFWLVDLKVIVQFNNCIIIYCKIDVNNIIFKEKKLVWVDFLQFFEICFCHEDSKPTVQVSIVERVGWENIHDQVPSYPHVVIADNVSTPPSRSAIFILYLLVLTVLGIFPKATSQVATSQMCYFWSGNFPKVWIGLLKRRIELPLRKLHIWELPSIVLTSSLLWNRNPIHRFSGPFH